MSINQIIEVPTYVEFVDCVRKNPKDTDKKIYTVTDNIIETIQWCRRNFGERGDGWDFTGAYKKVDIIIWSSKLVVMFELWKR